MRKGLAKGRKSMGANIAAVMKRLRAKGKVNTAQIYRRHGVKDATLGVSFADLGKLARDLGTDHLLAQALWKSGVHDARMLAIQVSDPQQMTTRTLDAWIAEASNYIITDALAVLAARTRKADRIMARWIARRGEWTTAGGWSLAAQLALGGNLDTNTARSLLDKIVRNIGAAKNRERHAMNNALIAIGGSIEELRDPARSAARIIGKVEVDHGQTGCKTPEAEAYIARMVAHARRTSARSNKAKAR